MSRKSAANFLTAVLLAAFMTSCTQSEENAETLSAEATALTSSTSESKIAAVETDIAESEAAEGEASYTTEKETETNETTESEVTEEDTTTHVKTETEISIESETTTSAPITTTEVKDAIVTTAAPVVTTTAATTTTVTDTTATTTAAVTTEAEQLANIDLKLTFGYEGSTFTLHLYDNDTALAIARHVGTADWNLPIYHYDDYENWEYFQYYDIPSHYEIPDGSDKVKSEKGGEVYYSHPNRIILFYNDAEIEGTYTKIGYFDYTDDFVTAVEENPVLEGWGNKIVSISSAD